MKKKIILFSSIAFFLITCTNEKGPVPMVQTTSAGDCDTAYWYTGIIEPIIITNCTSTPGCHGAGGSAVPYTSYAGVKYDVDNGTFNSRLFVVKDMPKSPVSPLSASQLDRINCWLTHGAPLTAAASTCSYSGTIASLIATNNCSVSGCHDAASAYGNYTSFSGLQVDAANGKLHNRVVVLKGRHPFPVSPSPPLLSDADISKIDCWIKEGALNN